jgi:hypothetical protein
MVSVSLVESKTKGAPTAAFRRADGREFYLHSLYDPLEEARFLVRDVPVRERTLYVVLGFGLGYHVKELLQRMPRSSHVIVLEPDQACLSGKLLQHGGSQTTAWMHNGRLHFLAQQDPHVAHIYLADTMVRLRLLSLELVTHIPSTLTAEGFYRALLAEIPRSLSSSFHSHLNSLDRMMENDLQNFWANLPHSWNAVPVPCLHGKWSGRPLIIVSAGPSLTGALPILQEARGKALIVATGSAAGILMARQVRPDLVVSVDPYEANLAHFQGWDHADVPLVYYHRINRGILSVYSGPRFFFLMRDDPPLPLDNPSEKPDFWQGGSVAFSALQLAHHMEASPIIFVGQDFAFAGGHTHAEGSVVDHPYDAGALPKDYFLVPGVHGKPVVTNRMYHSYLLYMQDYLLRYATSKPAVKHINTSQSGAMIQGMECQELGRVLAGQPEPAPFTPREMIASALVQCRRIPWETQRAALQKWITELGHLLAQAGQAHDFDRLFARFKATSPYAQATRSYDDIYYLYEARYRGDKNQEPSAFMNRFHKHLQWIYEHLCGILGDA